MLKASTVSRQLRQQGFRPLPSGTKRSREGLRVRQGYGGTVYVVADLDSERQAMQAKHEVALVLFELGYVTYSTDGSRVLRVQLNPDPPRADGREWTP